MPNVDKSGGGEMPIPRVPLFKIGDTPRDMQIIRVTKRSTLISKVRYMVNPLNCGHQFEITHRSLLNIRRAEYTGLCSNCLRGKKRRWFLATGANLAPAVNPKRSRQRAHEIEKQLANQWAHALWAIPHRHTPPPNIPRLGLINRLETR